MSPTRRLLYGLLVTALALTGMELALRASGLVDQELLLSPLLFQQIDYAPAPMAKLDGRVQWHDGQLFAAEPPGLRVITLGGSATAGDGVTAFGSFSHQLQRLLVRAQPERPAEVINMGRGGMGSRQVAQLLDQGLASLHPQLAVIYAGNNEFHELRALAYASPAYGANLERTRRRLHGLHLYRALQRALGRDELEPFAPMGRNLPAVHELPTTVGADDRALAAQLYRENLTAMARSARQAGVPLILATVADNRAGWVDAPPSRQLTQVEERLLAELDGLRASRDPQAVLALAERAWPELHDERSFYRMGRALLELGQLDTARRFLDQSELVMARPNRSNMELRQVVREVAEAQDIPLCEVADELDRLSSAGVAGNDLFVDACHPSPEGHAHIAALLGRCAERAGLWPSAAWEEPLSVDPWRLDHHAGRLGEPEDPDALSEPALAHALRGHQAFSARDFDGAFSHYAQALEAGGPQAALLTDQALVRWRQGRTAELEALMGQAVAAAPEDPEIVNWKALLTR